MTVVSALINTHSHVAKIARLSLEAVAIDQGVALSLRDGRIFVNRFNEDFRALPSSDIDFSKRWSQTLQHARDAASSLSAWFNRFDHIFLAMIDDMKSETDAQDLVAELQAFVSAAGPTTQYHIVDAPGVRKSFTELEHLVHLETHRLIQIVDSESWQSRIQTYKQEVPAIREGIQRIREALNKFATNLE